MPIYECMCNYMYLTGCCELIHVFLLIICMFFLQCTIHVTLKPIDNHRHVSLTVGSTSAFGFRVFPFSR